jgi:amino acid transporter
MANINRYGGSSEDSPERKGYPVDVNQEQDEPIDTHHHLHRGLKSRQITMIAIGGAIGTGLIIGT